MENREELCLEKEENIYVDNQDSLFLRLREFTKVSKFLNFLATLKAFTEGCSIRHGSRRLTRTVNFVIVNLICQEEVAEVGLLFVFREFF